MKIHDYPNDGHDLQELIQVTLQSGPEQILYDLKQVEVDIQPQMDEGSL